MKAVYVEWEDAVSSDKEFNANLMQDWSDITYMKRQIGFIYEETDDHITLFSGIHQDEEYYDMFQGIIKIPKSLIRERNDFEITEVPEEEEKDAESVVKEYVERPKDLADSLEDVSPDCDCYFCKKQIEIVV